MALLDNPRISGIVRRAYEVLELKACMLLGIWINEIARKSKRSAADGSSSSSSSSSSS